MSKYVTETMERLFNQTELSEGYIKSENSNSKREDLDASKVILLKKYDYITINSVLFATTFILHLKIDPFSKLINKISQKFNYSLKSIEVRSFRY